MHRFPRSLSWLLVTAAQAVLFVHAGCGLTLDYDPPEDGGFDAALDAPALDGGDCRACPAGTTCIRGTCLTTCVTADDCNDDTVCETCDPVDQVCVPADATCSGGCNPTCDPVLDACVANCGPTEACIGGMCDARTACSGDGECAGLPPNRCGASPVCLGGFCQDGSVPTCPAYPCGTADPCDECVVTRTPDACGAGLICDDAYQCVQCTLTRDEACAGPTPICDVDASTCRPCTTDVECFARGRGSACLATGECAACRTDVHCRVGQVCDSARNVCVGCLSNADCAGGQICDLTSNTCRICREASECGLGQLCTASGCTPIRCTAAAMCPTTPCSGPPECPSGVCLYPAASDIECDDGIDCTDDLCRPTDRAAVGGCVHVRQSALCGDDIDCTIDVCAGRRLGGGDGCIHRPDSTTCEGPRDCVDHVCIPEGATVAGSGCVPRYVTDRCAAGEICEADGDCQARGCGDACLDDGNPCNGVEQCDVRTGACAQVFGMGCTGACNEVCSDGNACELLGGVPVTCAP